MSKFFKALKQAEEDRIRQEEGEVAPATPAPVREPVMLRRADAGVDDAPAALPPAIAPTAAPAAPTPPPGPVPQAAALPPAPPPAPVVTTHVAPEAAELVRPALAKAAQNGATPVEEHLVTLLAPTSFEAEQYRTLRTLLDAKRVDGGPRVIAVSSPTVGDGKTTTSINLAGVLAESEDSRVLLIDGDLRNPSVGSRLGIPRSTPGLTAALRGRGVTIDSLVVRRQPFNLDVLTAGESSKAPYELLKSSTFAELLKEARGRYEFVIVDTPPIVSLPDCRVICTMVDAFIIVVAAHRTPKKMVEEALNALDPEKVLGFIFNSDEQPLSGYRYYYPYGETYGPSRRRKGKKGENA